MTPFQAFILGIVQGLSEFLPISSSAHLVLVPYLLNWEMNPEEAFIFDILVQVATLFAVIAFFKDDLIQLLHSIVKSLRSRNLFGDPQAKLAWFILIATIPAGFFGLLLKDYVEQAFASIVITSIALLITAVLLLIAEFIGKKTRPISVLTIKDTLWIGMFQVLAIFPGISRSGATIAGGMTRDIERGAAARFAFLMSVPIMLAAGALALVDLAAYPDVASVLVKFIPGFISSAVVGYLSIRWLLKFLVTQPLYVFSIYCSILGITSLLVYFLRL